LKPPPPLKLSTCHEYESQFIAVADSHLLAAACSSCARLHHTTYSREEEKQLTGDLLKLITGQFAQHGPAFYTNEVTTLTAKLMESPDDVEARNDLAAAQLKMGEYETALTLFDEIEKSHPGRYRTQANLGVLRKKMGDFDVAAKHIENSLKIKPEGHLGLGDYYLKMLRWMKEVESLGDPGPAKNFLGVSYSAGPKATVASKDFNREHIVTLIKADWHFADAMLVLGDALFVEENYERRRAGYVGGFHP
jgi:tetratricopeptide (TPR) repeat protein